THKKYLTARRVLVAAMVEQKLAVWAERRSGSLTLEHARNRPNFTGRQFLPEDACAAAAPGVMGIELRAIEQPLAIRVQRAAIEKEVRRLRGQGYDLKRFRRIQQQKLLAFVAALVAAGKDMPAVRRPAAHQNMVIALRQAQRRRAGVRRRDIDIA